jgi:hypothetical protein
VDVDAGDNEPKLEPVVDAVVNGVAGRRGVQAAQKAVRARIVRDVTRKARPNVSSALGDLGQRNGGAFQQVQGHLFEKMDADAISRTSKGRVVIKLSSGGNNPGYDGVRLSNGKFTGGVQHKLSGQGAARAAKKIETAKPGSAARATVRVPVDQVGAARQSAAGRIRVKASSVSKRQV